jgi:hypothetical protein
VSEIDWTPKGLCMSSAIRKRARDVTLSAWCSSSETSIRDSTFVEDKPIYVRKSNGTL